MVPARTWQLAAKLLRILLVFVLTFGLTLHVEYLAFAVGTESTSGTEGANPNPPTESTKTEDENSVSGDTGGNTGDEDDGNGDGNEDGGLDESESTSSSSDEPESSSSSEEESSSSSSEEESSSSSSESSSSSSESGSSSSSSSSEDEEKPPYLLEDETILDLTVYMPDEQDAEKVGKKIQSATGVVAKNKQFQTPTIDKLGGSASYRAVLTVQNEAGDKRAIDSMEYMDEYVEWSLEETDLAKVESKKGYGIVSATAAGNGSVTVTCSITEGYSDYVDPSFDGEYLEVPFKVEIEGQVPFYVANVEILDKNGQPFEDGKNLTTADLDNGKYEFQAKVSVLEVIDSETEKPVDPFICTPANGLAKQSEDELGYELPDLAWTVSSAGDARIDSATGRFDLKGAKSAEVTCTSTAGRPDEEVNPSDSVSVEGEKPKEPEAAPYVKAIDILDEDGKPIPHDGSITIPIKSTGEEPGLSASGPVSSSSSETRASSASDEEAGSTTYQFGARVTVAYPSTDSAAERERVFIFDGKALAPVDGNGEATASSSTVSSEPSSPSSAETESDSEDKESGKTSESDSSDSSSSSSSGGSSTSTSSSSSGSNGSGSSKETTPSFALKWEVASEAATSMTDDGLLTLTSQKPAIVTCYTLDGNPELDGGRVAANVTVNPGEKSEEVPEGLYLDYHPVPYGETALVTLNISKLRDITFIIHWEEYDKDANGWVETEPQLGKGFSGSQYLTRPTVEPYVGARYRAYIEILAGSQQYNRKPTEPVTIEVGKDEPRVDLYLQNAPENGIANFTTSVRGLSSDVDPSKLKYTWFEINKDTGATVELASGYLPTYEMKVTAANLANRYKVRVTPPEGEPFDSNVITLTATVPSAGTDDSSDKTSDKEGGGSGSSSGGGASGGSDSGGGSSGGVTQPIPYNPPDLDSYADSEAANSEGATDASNQGSGQEPEETPQPATDDRTLSERVDEEGSAAISFDDGTTATMTPVGSVTRSNQSSEDSNKTPNEGLPDLEVNPRVNQQVAEAQAEKREAEMNSQPGLRWNPVYFKQETTELPDLLSNNALAPFVLPFCLAVLAAGALEKYLRFREQKRKSLAAF